MTDKLLFQPHADMTSCCSCARLLEPHIYQPQGVAASYFFNLGQSQPHFSVSGCHSLILSSLKLPQPHTFQASGCHSLILFQHLAVKIRSIRPESVSVSLPVGTWGSTDPGVEVDDLPSPARWPLGPSVDVEVLLGLVLCRPCSCCWYLFSADEDVLLDPLSST